MPAPAAASTRPSKSEMPAMSRPMAPPVFDLRNVGQADQISAQEQARGYEGYRHRNAGRRERQVRGDIDHDPAGRHDYRAQRIGLVPEVVSHDQRGEQEPACERAD